MATDQDLAKSGLQSNSNKELFMNKVQQLLPSFNQLNTLFGFAAVMALAVGIILWSSKPSYKPIDISFNKGQISQAIQILDNENIDYQYDTGSNLLLVPINKLDKAYLLLGNAGIQKIEHQGMELLQDKQGYTSSKFVQTARYQHALEVELARTISNMRNIDNARVHIAQNKRSSLLKSAGESSASVMLSISPGRVLESGQVLSIMELVAASVPYMKTANVKVVDHRGNLLSSDHDADMMANNKQFAYKKKIESDYKQRIEDLLTPYVGVGQLKVEVNADVDFNQAESSIESYAPDGAKVRSEKIQEQQSTNATIAGVPGALTNQPPGAGTTAAGNEENDENPINNTNRNEVRNYELDKTITYTKKSLGEVQRLSVAVLMNTKTITNVDNKGNETKEEISLTADELLNIEKLIKGTIGFNEERGDSVTVYNIPFYAPVESAVTNIPIWQKPFVWDIAKKALGGLLVLILFFKVIKPIIFNLPARFSTVSASDDDAENENRVALNESMENRIPVIEKKMEQLEYMTANNAELPPAHVYGDILNMAKELAKQDPKRVAKVVKDWVGDDE